MNATVLKSLGFASGFAMILSVALLRPAAAESRVLAETPGTALALPASLRAFAAASASEYLAVPAKTGQANGDEAYSSSAAASVSEDADLPEAPEPAASGVSSTDFAAQASGVSGTAPHFALTIPSGWTAQHLSAGDKMVIGLRDLFSPITVAGVIISSGYSHLVDGQPNYGVDGTAYAKRFGAGMARSSSQDVFSVVVLSPLLHQDPRYYIEGPQYSFFHRVMYVATRPFIGRTDGGRSTVNASLLIGYAGAAALTPAYYPQINHNFKDVASTYGSSLGGAAIGFAFSEFSDQLFKAVHLKH